MKSIQNYLQHLPQPISISLSSTRYVIKAHFNGKYKRVDKINKVKNDPHTVAYRKDVAKKVIAHIADNALVISIDETSFSSYPSKSFEWTLPHSNIDMRKYREKPHKNISLLMAVSNQRVEAYTIIENGINQIVFANFIIHLVENIKAKNESAVNNIILLLDNLLVHKTPLVKTVVLKMGIKVIFNAPYSPEMNFIENMFQRIKNRINKQDPHKNLYTK